MNKLQLFQNLMFLFLSLFLAGCTVSQNASTAVLLKVDSDFSNVSKEHGVKTAFLQYIDDSAVLLKPNAYPIVGAAAKQFYLNQTSHDYSLTWMPQAATIARS